MLRSSHGVPSGSVVQSAGAVSGATSAGGSSRAENPSRPHPARHRRIHAARTIERSHGCRRHCQRDGMSDPCSPAPRPPATARPPCTPTSWRFVAGLAARGDPRLHVTDFGRSPGPRAAAADRSRATACARPEEARRAGLPVVLVHRRHPPRRGRGQGGEPRAACATCSTASTPTGSRRRHARGRPAVQPRRQRRARPRQPPLDLPKARTASPAPSSARRTQSQGINLNRDYMRQAAPEMRLSCRPASCSPWAPDLTIDNHATNGSRAPLPHDRRRAAHRRPVGRAEPIAFMRERMVPDVIAAVAKNHQRLRLRLVRQLRRGRAHPRRRGDPSTPEPRCLGLDDLSASPAVRLQLSRPHQPPRPPARVLQRTSPSSERVHTAYATMADRGAALGRLARRRDRASVVACAAPPDRDRRPLPPRPAFTEPVEILDAPSRAPSTGRSLRAPPALRPSSSAPPRRPPARLRRSRPRSPITSQRHGLPSHRRQRRPRRGRARPHRRPRPRGRARKILEAAEVGDLHVAWQAQHPRSSPRAIGLVSTDQPLGAIAVYLCEPESDDNAIENGLIPAPSAGDEYPIWRVV
jgi:hypothetical protein